MRVSPRALVCVCFGAGAVLLAAGCGAEADGARTTLVNIQPSSYVVQDPVTTTSTTVVVPSGDVTGTASTYTVQAGDSVFQIAAKFEIEPEVLANFNSWPDGVQHELFAGDVIDIPPGAKIPDPTADAGDTGDDEASADEASGDASTGGPVETAPDGRCQHTIAAGDNPSTVANQYDISVEQLDAANADSGVMDDFIPGDVLIIPPEGSC